LANALVDDFGDRGLVVVHAIIDDGTGDGVVDWKDAKKWHLGNDGAHTPLYPEIIVLADDDYGLWTRFHQSCNDLTPGSLDREDCDNSCPYTPQAQVIDQGGVTVSDTCARPPGEVECTQCGYSDSYYRKVLDDILPAVWCGESIN
jgi:hypothetical protein